MLSSARDSFRPLYRDAYITIASRTGNIADLRHGRRESGSAAAWAISFALFGHEASAVITSIRPNPLLVLERSRG
jgi:hypothetical protein